jgi:hypothetical protein
VVATQASVLALIGLAFGIPLGLILGRYVWRAVAGFTPLAYHPPVALLAILLISPITLLVANTLASGRSGRRPGYTPGRYCGLNKGRVTCADVLSRPADVAGA